jgi:hypothetical protein
MTQSERPIDSVHRLAEDRIQLAALGAEPFHPFEEIEEHRAVGQRAIVLGGLFEMNLPGRRRRCEQRAPCGAGDGWIIRQRQRSTGPAKAEVLGRIGINSEVIRLPAEARGNRIHQRILRPDTGMMQFGLMTGRDQRYRIIVSNRFSRLLAEMRERRVLNVNVVRAAQTIMIIERVLKQLRGAGPNEGSTIRLGCFPIGVGDGRLGHDGLTTRTR